MQSVSNAFKARADAGLRPLTERLFISFPKTFGSSITFFTIGTSTIGGTDFIKGDGSVVQEWDKYNYAEFTDRIMSYEYTREQDQPIGGMVMAMLDITLDNHDDYFTPNHDPIIGSYILPARPVRLACGFGGEDVPVFVGLTEGMPEIDQVKKTVKFHCVDFLSSLYNSPLDQAVIMQNKRVDEAIDTMLQLAGLTSSQYVLEAGFTVIPFVYFEKGVKLGEAIKQLVQSEMGTLYQDEQGVINFENRQHWTLAPHTSSQWTYGINNCYAISTPRDDNLVNVVEVTSNAREVQENQKLWENSGTIEVPAGATVDVWADFRDSDGAMPVTSVDTPINSTSQLISAWQSNDQADYNGTDTASLITLNSHTAFSTSYLMNFTNTDTSTAYLKIILFGTPAKVVHRIYTRKEDTTSTGIYNEHPLQITNNFIQTQDVADQIAQMILTDHASPEQMRDLDVPHLPPLQVGDLVTLNEDGTPITYFVAKISATISTDGKMKLRLIKRTIQKYFRIGISTIGGSDPIGP